MDQTKSRDLLDRARQTIPGGVNSPVRAFTSVESAPPFIVRGDGAYLEDADGHRYIDYVGSWGPLILGHAHPRVLAAITEAAGRGTSFGAPTEGEVALAEKVCEVFPSVEMVRLVNSGTEATMSAVRVARGVTGRDKFVKFVGCYHGHGDGFLIEAGSGLATHGVPSSPGVPASTAADTLTAPYNDLQATRALFDQNPEGIAAVIVEPVAGNMGCVPPREGYLEGLRALCTERGAVLIFDEVMSGFRCGPQSAQGRFGVTPDLTTFGKVIGGGLPVGAYGGKAEFMSQVSPAGPIYQAGTLSGNPIAVAAGLAVLEELYSDPSNFDRLETGMDELATGLEAAAAAAGVAYHVQRVGSMGCGYFSEEWVYDFDDARRCDADAFHTFHTAMLERGVYLAPSPFEAFFLSLAHGPEEISHTLTAAKEAFAAVAAKTATR